MTKNRPKLGHFLTQTFRENLHKRAGARDRRDVLASKLLRHSFWELRNKFGMVVLHGSVKKTRAGLFSLSYFCSWGTILRFVIFLGNFDLSLTQKKRPTFAFLLLSWRTTIPIFLFPNSQKQWRKTGFCDKKIAYDMKGNELFWSKTGPQWTENRPKL